MRGENDFLGIRKTAGGMQSPSFSPRLHISYQSEQSQFHGFRGKNGLPEADLSISIHTTGSTPHIVPRIWATHFVVATKFFLQLTQNKGIYLCFHISISPYFV